MQRGGKKVEVVNVNHAALLQSAGRKVKSRRQDGIEVKKRGPANVLEIRDKPGTKRSE